MEMNIEIESGEDPEFVNEEASTYTCVIHSREITHYCQSCNDIICAQCFEKQPHSSLLHKVDTLQNSFARRRQFLDSFVSENVNPKRESLMQHIMRLQERVQVLQANYQVISRDISVEYQGAKEKLDAAGLTVASRLQAEMKRLSLVVNSIDDIFYSFEESVKVPEKFLLLYKSFKTKITETEVFRIQPELQEEIRLPQEIINSKKNAETLALVQEKSKLIDEVLYQIIKTYQSFVKQQTRIAKAKNKEVISSFYNLNNRILQSQREMYKICYYCGVGVSNDSINNTCILNRSAKFDREGYTFDCPPDKYNGNRRHFWGDAKLAYRLKPHNFTSNSQEIFSNSLRKLKLPLMTLKQYLYQNELSIKKLFGTKEEVEKVSQLAFMYTLINKVKLSEHEAEVLAGLLTDKEQNHIKMIEFEQLVQDPFLHFRKYKQEEEQKEKKSSFGPRSKYLFK